MFIVISSELVVNLGETKFKNMISSNADVIDRMKIQNVKFSPKSGMSYVRKFSLVYVRQDVARAEGKCVGHHCAPPRE